MKFTLATVAAAAMAASVAAADLDPIVIKGTKFFKKTSGDQFYMKGVAYQQESTDSKAFYKDPLADEAACKRDVPVLKDLGTNTIRVYAIDPTKNHDPCMKLLQDAGIYVVSDLSEPQTSINRDDPQWDDTVYARYTAVIDDLQQYSNVLGFFAGNEVSNQANNTAASAYVKAAVRDTKAYIKQKGYRAIPVGYATNDDADIRVDLASYFNCNTKDESVDFWGYNIYSWCGKSSFKESGYDLRTKEYEDYSVPVFFAEYGCNQVKPRLFTEVEALYGSQMTGVWSGGIVYMYYQEANDYGLVEIVNNKVQKIDGDYGNLKEQIAAVKPATVSMNAYTPTNTKLRDCPVEGSAWRASSKLPPTPNQELCSCMVKSLGCVAKDSVETTKYGDLFSFICDTASCTGITGNGTTGAYGAYSMCNPVERLSWAMNAYYNSQKKASTACDFDGQAQTQSPSSSTGDCATLIKEAGGVEGTGTVTSAPKSSKSSASGAIVVPVFQIGALNVGLAVVTAFFGGAALIFV